jgi:hypothetical protein
MWDWVGVSYPESAKKKRNSDMPQSRKKISIY